jgi:hypothetical protein
MPAWLPKVDLVEPVQTKQEVEPTTISDSDEEAHTFSREQFKRQPNSVRMVWTVSANLKSLPGGLGL